MIGLLKNYNNEKNRLDEILIDSFQASNPILHTIENSSIPSKDGGRKVQLYVFGYGYVSTLQYRTVSIHSGYGCIAHVDEKRCFAIERMIANASMIARNGRDGERAQPLWL